MLRERAKPEGLAYLEAKTSTTAKAKCGVLRCAQNDKLFGRAWSLIGNFQVDEASGDAFEGVDAGRGGRASYNKPYLYTRGTLLKSSSVEEAAGDAGVGVDAAVAEEGPVLAGYFDKLGVEVGD
jgi:hypothetical protein